MTPDERRNQIVAIVESGGASTPAYLAERFGVSEDSIRRDLRSLACELGPDRVVRLAQERRVRASQQPEVADLGVEDPGQRDVARDGGRGSRGGVSLVEVVDHRPDEGPVPRIAKQGLDRWRVARDAAECVRQAV